MATNGGNLLSGNPLVVFQPHNEPHSRGVQFSSSDPESIVSQDGDRRQRVPNSKEDPYRNILRLTARFPPLAMQPSNTHTFSQPGTAFLTNQTAYYNDEAFAVALTAAHVLCPDMSSVREGADAAKALFCRRPDNLATSLVVKVAVNGSGRGVQDRPYKTFEIYRQKSAMSAASDCGWYEVSPSWYSKCDGYMPPDWKEDFGALFLKKSMLPAECTGFSTCDDPAVFNLAQYGDVVCAGYPNDKPPDTLWMSVGRIRRPDVDTRYLSISSSGSSGSGNSIPQFEHDADTETGQSGSPLFISTQCSTDDSPASTGASTAGRAQHVAIAIHHKGAPRVGASNTLIVACNEALRVDRALMAKVLEFKPPAEWLTTLQRRQLPGKDVPDIADKLQSLALSTPPLRGAHESLPTACGDESQVSAAAPVVGSSFQHYSTMTSVAMTSVEPLSSTCSSGSTSAQSSMHYSTMTSVEPLSSTCSSGSTSAQSSMLDSLTPPQATGPIKITQEPLRHVRAPFGENVRLTCEAMSCEGGTGDLFYQWYYTLRDEPIQSGQVLRLNNVQKGCSVYCTVSSERGYRVTSVISEITIGGPETNSSAHQSNPAAGLTSSSSTSTSAAGISGVEGNHAAAIDAAAASSPPANPWNRPEMSAVAERLKARMDATPVCNRLLRQSYLSESDIETVTAAVHAASKNALIIDKIKSAGWRSLEALYQALVLTSQEQLASALHEKAKELPGYPHFQHIAAPRSQRGQRTKLTKENIDRCKDRLSPEQIAAVSMRFCNETRLVRFALKAGLSVNDLEVHCGHNSKIEIQTVAVNVVTYLVQEREFTVRKILKVANHTGCRLSVRDALLEADDAPVESDESN